MLINQYGDQTVKGAEFALWYPPIEQDMPRAYHENMSPDFKEEVYTKKNLRTDRAWLVGFPENNRVHCYDGAKVKLVQEPVNAELFPGSNKKNNIPDAFAVKNIGDAPCYIRMHVAIPTCLDESLPDFDASKNLLHFNADKEVSLAVPGFNWSKTKGERAAGSMISSGWNYETVTIDGIDYAVYVATFERALQPGETSPNVIFQAYLDAKATADDLSIVYDILKTNKWEIKVAVEASGVDTETYTDPFEIFNTCSDPATGRDLFNTDFVTHYVPANEEVQSGTVTPPASPSGDDPAGPDTINGNGASVTVGSDEF